MYSTGSKLKDTRIDNSGTQIIGYLGGFGVSATRMIGGSSYVSDTADGEPQYEPIIMLGTISSAGILPLTFPSESEDYRNISWTPLETFAENVRDRKVSELVVATEWDEVYACVRGLCLATSVSSTLNMGDTWLHMGYRNEGDIFRYYSCNPQLPSTAPFVGML